MERADKSNKGSSLALYEDSIPLIGAVDQNEWSRTLTTLGMKRWGGVTGHFVPFSEDEGADREPLPAGRVTAGLTAFLFDLIFRIPGNEIWTGDIEKLFASKTISDEISKYRAAFVLPIKEYGADSSASSESEEANPDGHLILLGPNLHYDEEEAKLAATLAHRSLSVIGMKESLDREREKLQRLNEVTRALGSTLELPRLIDLVLEQTLRFTGGQRAFIMLLDDDDKPQFYAGMKFPDRKMTEKDFRVSHTITGRVLESGQPLCVIDTEMHDDLKNKDSIVALQLRSLMCCPMIHQDKTLGLLYVDSKFHAQTFGERDLDLLEALVGNVAVVIENARLTETWVKRERLSAVGLAVNGIVHDLKNPMATMRGYAQMIERKSGSDKIKGYAKEIRREVDRLVEVTRDILDFTSGQRKLRKLPGDLNETLRDAIDYCRTNPDYGSTEIHFAPGDLGTVSFDSERLSRVILNITMNAIEAMKDSGEIKVESRILNNNIEIIVRDNGPGIPPDFLPLVFEPFETYNKPGGTGLGLSIARSIVRDHGGDIEAESELGQGAVFSITIPKS